VNETRGSKSLDDALEVLPIDDATFARSAACTPHAVVAEHRRRVTSTFSRLTVLHPRQLSHLPAWWIPRAGDGRLRATRRLTLAAPEQRANDMWRMHGWLRPSRFGRRIRVDLHLWPVLGAWTKLTLEPQTRVHLGRRYFRTGHRALDDLTTRLCTELPADS
jgi:hypothetical protein